MNNEDRWKQRFQNFDKAFQVFQRRIDEYENDPGSEAFQMALIQAFEMLLELSWKTLKDYLENEGMAVTTPKAVIRQAFQSELIENGEEWMDALSQRNLTSHIYDDETARQVLSFVSEHFYPIVRDLYHRLKREI
ncbi:MAG: nucleotidyltransferase substrate binding protein [Proteobacteria bacterium]|nr:nucleotidyltransferase substrate binding protein [Pseudomonadota bacterium]